MKVRCEFTYFTPHTKFFYILLHRCKDWINWEMKMRICKKSLQTKGGEERQETDKPQEEELLQFHHP